MSTNGANGVERDEQVHGRARCSLLRWRVLRGADGDCGHPLGSEQDVPHMAHRTPTRGDDARADV
jgi:hypothetical protein